jgi:hypothetical protein
MRWRTLAAVAAGVWGSAGGALAQDIRITGASWVQAIDLRPLRRDSVLASTTTGTDSTRRAPTGELVFCAEGSAWCTFLAGGPREQTRPFLQDLSVAGWGFGEGVSFHAHARFRDALGSSPASWPRVEDRFDLLDAYVELDRSRFRARLGRQWQLGGLGAYNYDGGSLMLRHDRVDGDVYGGRALVQGLFESYTSAELGAVDDLPPDTPAWLVGGRVRVRPGGSTALAVSYLRVVQDDRAGLFAERAAVDASARALGVRLTGNFAYDVASNVVNEARLRGSRTLARHVDLALEVRRHRPFFELWTIWGAFAPVGFDEARATTAWSSPAGTLAVSASGAYRVYEDAGTGLQSVELRNDGWRAAVDGSWSPDERITATAGYGVDIGFGSSQSDGTVGVTWRPAERLEVGASASALQTIYEFRVGTGRVLGAAGNALVRLTSDVRLRVDAGMYRHRLTNDAPGQDWSQRRASVRLEWAVGADPGASR